MCLRTLLKRVQGLHKCFVVVVDSGRVILDILNIFTTSLANHEGPER